MPRVFKEWSCGTSGTGDGLTEEEVLALAVKPDYEAAESDAAGILNKPDLTQSETFNADKAAATGYVKGVSRVLWNGYQYILNTDAVLQASRGNTDTVDQTALPSDGDGSESSDWVRNPTELQNVDASFPTVQLMLASSASYSDYEQGDLITVKSGSHSYEVALDTSTDSHVETSGGLKLYVIPGHNGYDIRAFGALPGSPDDVTGLVQKVIDMALTGAVQQVYAPDGPYLISSLSVGVKILGTINNRFGSGPYTFGSSVGAGDFAIVLDNVSGSLERVTVRNTGAGNGIWAALASTQETLSSVSTSTTYPLVTGSGSVGVAYGSDAAPGQQAITTVFNVVNSRDYDILHDIRYYSNSNTYTQLYALRTDNLGQPSTAGFRVNGRGSTYITCNAESNILAFLDEQTGANGAEENTYINFWAEGEPGGVINLLGIGSLMINPYGFVGGGSNIDIPINKGPYSTVIKKKGPRVGNADFGSQSDNLFKNSGVSEGLSGLNWNNAALSGSQIYGFNSVSIESASATTSITSDHLLNYIDLTQNEWLLGKTVTMACFGIAEAGVSMSLRGIVRTTSGSNLQYATSQTFSSSVAEIQKVSFNIPDDAQYLVFRIYASGGLSGSPAKAGEIASPVVFLGNDLQDMRQKSLVDGENTIYGDMKFVGGKPVLPEFLWATLPQGVAGAMIYIPDHPSGPSIGFHNGTNWAVL